MSVGGNNGVISSEESLAISSAYDMHCTVCAKNYQTTMCWLRHLVELEHQTLARAECLKMWGEDKAMKECVVAVFCSFALTYSDTVMDVLRRFSSNGRCIVTDFAWWPERPRIGFMQFESKYKVAEVLKGLEASSSFVENKLVQLKRAVDFLTLEWKELFPSSEVSNERPSSSVNFSSPQALPSRTSSLPTNIAKPTADVRPTLMYDGIAGEIRMTSTMSSSVATCTSKYLSPTSVPFPPSAYILNADSPLQVQFNNICKSVEIPEDEIQHALEIANVLKQILREDNPSGEIIMTRNYYLRLRNTGSNVLLLHAYISDNPSDSKSFTYIPKHIHEAIFDSSQFKRCLSGFKRLSFSNCDIGGTPFRHETSGFRFNFSTDPITIAETYLCLFLQYLCSFDTRVRPLFTLIYFWAKAQGVRIAEEHISKDIYHSNCPEPAGLEWLVILFLIHEGIIPSVREVQERPHKPLEICEVRRDISFAFDEKWASDWSQSKSPPVPSVNSDKFLVSVITLVQKFFHFYSTNLKDGCWLLNPKDGEIIKREGTHCHKSKLSPEETNALNIVQEKVSLSGRSHKQHLIISDCRIYMLHPLYITRRLSFCVDTWTESTCEKMKRSAEYLEKYLKSAPEKRARHPKSATLESVLAGGRRQSENAQTEMQCDMNQSLRKAIRTRIEQRKRQGNRNSESCSDSEASYSRNSKQKRF